MQKLIIIKLLIIMGLNLFSCSDSLLPAANPQSDGQAATADGPFRAPDWLSILDYPTYSAFFNRSKSVGLFVSKTLARRCTAFLVHENMILTNNHCLPESSENIGGSFEPDIYSEKDSNSSNKYACENVVSRSQELDYALINCEGAPGLKHSRLELQKTPWPSGQIYMLHQNCNIYENASCAPIKQISEGIAFEKKNQKYLYHTADAISGSSGSPIIDKKTQKVVGLHSRGFRPKDIDNEPENEAIPMYKIIQDLSAKKIFIY